LGLLLKCAKCDANGASVPRLRMQGVVTATTVYFPLIGNMNLVMAQCFLY
jgi:hypothetical protein